MSKRKKPSTVRHTRSNQLARQTKPPTPPPDEVTAARIKEIIHPATMAQVSYYHHLGLRERTLTLPVMVALLLSLVWRQFSSVNEALRIWQKEAHLWAPTIRVSQQAISERLRTLPAELFARILDDVLPQLQQRWKQRQRPLPEEIKWALTRYERVWAVDGSTLDALVKRVGLLRNLPDHPLAGRMLAILDVTSRLPQRIWRTDDDRAHDQRFWDDILPQIPANTLLLFDLGFTNFARYRQLTERNVTFITRAKKNLSYRRYRIFAHHGSVHDYGIVVDEGGRPLRLRLVEVYYQGHWRRYLTNELDPQQLPVLYLVALYWQRWRIEDAYKQVKRLLGLAYFWVGSDNGVALQLWATWLLYAVLVDLSDEVAGELGVPLADISLEMVYRSLYFCVNAIQRGETNNPVQYLAENAQLFGLIKRKRKPPALTRLNLTLHRKP